MLVKVAEGSYSGYIVTGQRSLLPGGIYRNVIILVAHPGPDLAIGDVVTLTPDGKTVTASATIDEVFAASEWRARASIHNAPDRKNSDLRCDREERKQWTRETQGNELYENAIAEMRSPHRNTRHVVETLEKAIAAGSPHAAYALATWYLHGEDDVPQDFTEAVRLLELAAYAHHPDALYDLGACYANGEGVEEDRERAFELYLEAALHGEPISVFKVGRSYYYGDGVPEDRRVADIWLDRARELGTYEAEPGTD